MSHQPGACRMFKNIQSSNVNLLKIHGLRKGGPWERGSEYGHWFSLSQSRDFKKEMPKTFNIVGKSNNSYNMNTKKIYLGLIAILMVASAGFAFNAPVKKAPVKVALQWFQYNGGGISDPDNYSELPGMPSCNTGTNLCAIQAEEDGDLGIPTQAGVDSPTAVRKKI